MVYGVWCIVYDAHIPTNSMTLARQSPMMVLRRWPTCIALAIFGDEKSTSTLRGGRGGGVTPFVRIDTAVSRSSAGLKKKLMYPLGATDTGPRRGFSGRACTKYPAMSRGAVGPRRG